MVISRLKLKTNIMSNLNIDGVKKNTFDAIVIGSGISGGWAAKEFTEKGLKTLVLERGRDVKHIIDYPTTNKFPYEFEHRGEPALAIKKENPMVSRCYAFKEDSMHFFVKDKEHPYIEEKPFDWIRGYQVGGNLCFGPDRPSAGATLILKALQEMILPLTGPYGIKILRHGTVMSRSLPAYRETRMG